MDNDLEKTKISRERRKELRRKLKEQLGEKERLVYRSAFLSWLQFIMRILSFGLIAQAFSKLYLSQDIKIMNYFLSILFLNIIGYLISKLAKKYQGIPSQYARDQLKARFFEVFRKQDRTYFESYSTSDLITVASQGIDSLDTYYNLYLSTMLRTFFNCSTVLVLVLFLFPLGGLVFILSLPLIPFSILLIQKKSEKIMQAYWSSYMDVGNLFMDDLKGLNTLYSYSADEIYEKDFNHRAEEFRKSTMNLLKFQLQSVAYMDTVMYLGIGLSGFLAVVHLYQGKLSLFSFLFFLLIGAEFFTPIRELGYCMHLLMMNTKMADRIFTFLDRWEEQEEDETPGQELNEIQEIHFQKVSFSYDDRKLLEEVDFEVHKGDLFAIAGESGLGKSTLAKILFKELTNFNGDIKLDNQSIRDISRSDLMKSAFYIAPDSYVFNESIYENLRKAKDLSKEQMLAWIKERKILHYLDQLPEGLDTQVGENGQLISPGQRQQLICARALLANRKIYIFDEMTSSVDGENEEELLNLIKMMAQDAIVILISHKMKQVHQGDKVLFLGRNNKWYFDKPQQLYQQSEEYRNLYETQREMEAILYEKP